MEEDVESVDIQSVTALDVEAIPEDLRQLPQWVCWRYECRGDKETKVAYDAKRGAPASSTDADTWCSFEEALAVSKQGSDYAGIGFVFSESDPYCGVDLDECLDEDGNWLWGDDLVEWLATYAEVSPSGRGIKLILRATKPKHARCVKRGVKDDGTGVIEIYDRGRFFAITGRGLKGPPTEVTDCQERLDALCDFLWPRGVDPTVIPMAGRPIDDDQIEARAVAYLESMPAAISGQGGHNATYAAATAVVHGFCIAPDRALQLLQRHFNPRCQPPWSDQELQHKIDDAANKPHDFPAGWLRDADHHVEADDVDLSRLISGMSLMERQENPEREGPKAVVRRLCDVACETLMWLWPGRIPLGKFTLLAGDPGLGKSFVTLDMAARVSRGGAWPDLPLLKQEAGTVVLLNAEDDLEDTIAPRLKRAEAGGSKILAFEGIELCNQDRKEPLRWYFSLQNDLPRLEEIVLDNPDTRLIVFDPISAYCGKVDTHKNADVRSLLAPLADLASQYHVAILGVTHLSKTGGTKAVYRSMGSLAFTAAARAVWSAVKDTNDPGRRLFLPAKLNLAEDPDGLAYRIVEGRVAWETDPVKLHADDAFAAEMAAAESRPEVPNAVKQRSGSANAWRADRCRRPRSFRKARSSASLKRRSDARSATWAASHVSPTSKAAGSGSCPVNHRSQHEKPNTNLPPCPVSFQVAILGIFGPTWPSSKMAKLASSGVTCEWSTSFSPRQQESGTNEQDTHGRQTHTQGCQGALPNCSAACVRILSATTGVSG